MYKFGTRTLFVFIAIVALICSLVVPVIQSARQAALGMSCRNNLRQIELALLNYEAAYRSLPMAAETDSDGKLWRSWRSQVFPVFMEATSMFYDVNACWDSPTNMRLLPACVKCGSLRLAPLSLEPSVGRSGEV
jgi:type II secretory pathway pseudopilin PulG